MKLLSDIIPDQEHWTRGGASRDRSDILCAASSPSAVKWCLMGALTLLAPEHPIGWINKARNHLNYLIRQEDGNINDISLTKVEQWQDSATWDQVKRVIDKFDRFMEKYDNLQGDLYQARESQMAAEKELAKVKAALSRLVTGS